MFDAARLALIDDNDRLRVLASTASLLAHEGATLFEIRKGQWLVLEWHPLLAGEVKRGTA